MPQQPAQPDTGWFNTRKRRLTAVVGSLALLVMLFGVLQAWAVLGAVFKVQSASVVPLPPSSASVLEVDRVSDLPVDDSTGLVADVSGVDLGGGEFDAGSVLSDPADSAPARQSDPPSRLEIAQAMVSAGIATGDPGLSTIWNGQTSLNILVIGVDRREDGGDQNADVLLLVRLDLVEHTLTGVSIPRDLLVTIPGYGADKINASYNYGVLADPDDPVAGVAQVRDTIESDYGVHIDHYVLIDFNGFESVVDALGGVQIDVPYELVDTEYPTEDYGVETVIFAPGLQMMDGETALKYVRTRHADSDDARRERQIDVILAILDRGKSISSLTRADNLILAAGNAIQTSFSLEEQLTLSRLALHLDRSNISIQAIGEPLVVPGWTETGRWVYLGDPVELRQFITEALAGG